MVSNRLVLATVTGKFYSFMTKQGFKATVQDWLQQDTLNFWLTNNPITRHLLTRGIAWFSKIEQPLVRDISLATWRFFSDLDLSDARETQFKSVHACFTRQLKEGARPIDMNSQVLVSPSDAILGAHGSLRGTELLQAKGQSYTLEDFLDDPWLVSLYKNGCYATLRLTSGMYHRFHAPDDCRVQGITYISGDTWNVNSIALQRVAQLFCKNERAILRVRLSINGDLIALVPVAAVLVASIRLHFLDVVLSLRYRGHNKMTCDAPFSRGQEMGWFEHGSTIVVLAPEGYSLCSGLSEGSRIRMGTPLMKLPERDHPSD